MGQQTGNGGAMNSENGGATNREWWGNEQGMVVQRTVNVEKSRNGGATNREWWGNEQWGNEQR